MSKGMLPRIVYQMCVHGALIAGSHAKKMVGQFEGEPQDYDLLVPLHRWQTIALLIPESATPNKFGGWRFYVVHDEEEWEIDVWPDDPMNYLKTCKSTKGGPVVLVDFINNRAYSSEYVAV